MGSTPKAPVDTARDATLLNTGARTAVFAALRPALDALAAAAGTDARLGLDARCVLRAVIRTRPANSLGVSELAARASTPKTRILAALHELETCGYLARLSHIAPHLRAALPPVS